jgi:hypothetical protein
MMLEEHAESRLSSEINPSQDSGKPIHFYLAKFRFVIRPTGTMHLPPSKGATLRGGFGYAFKDLVCIEPSRQCNTCLIHDHCPYSRIFETPVPKDATIMRKYTHAPHPFVLTPPLDERTEFSEKDELSFDLVLIGRAIDYLPYFILAFEELGRRGLGCGHGRFRLLSVESYFLDTAMRAQSCANSRLQRKQVYHESNRILNNHVPPLTFSRVQMAQTVPHFTGERPQLTLQLLTPVRILTKGRLDHELNFTDFMRALLRRIQLLQAFYCLPSAPQDAAHDSLELSVDEIRRLLHLSESVDASAGTLHFCDSDRFSTRQNRRTPLGGLKGEIVFRFPSAGSFVEFAGYLHLGSLIHVGKETSFGLGKYAISGGPLKEPDLALGSVLE